MGGSGWFLQHDDARKDVGVLEDRRVAEVDDLLDRALFSEERAQRLAIARAHPLVGDDVGHPAALPQQPQALLVEIHI
jgi:hypothetical protein